MYTARPVQNTDYHTCHEHIPDKAPSNKLSSEDHQTRSSKDFNKTFSERPFTHMIDKMIEEEKNKSQVIQKDPMLEPVMSSTKRSDMSLEFQPLQPDPPSSLQQTTEMERSHPMSDEQFAKYYKNLSPFERKRQLQAQKSALLEEQRHLKAMLAEQEKLLRAKQNQLHMQQSLQQERLRYFERTGHFPPHDPALKMPYMEKEPFPLQDTNINVQSMLQSVPFSDGANVGNAVYVNGYEMPPTPMYGPFPNTPTEDGVLNRRCMEPEERVDAELRRTRLPKPVFFSDNNNNGNSL